MAELNIEAASAVAFPSRELRIDQGTAEVFQVIRAPDGKHKTALGFEMVETQQDLTVMLMGVANAQAQFISIEAARFVSEDTNRRRISGAIDDGVTLKAFVDGSCIVVVPVMLFAKAERAKNAGLLTDYAVWDYLSDYDRWYLVPKADRPTLIVSQPEVVIEPADEERGKKATLVVTVRYEMRPGRTITELWDTTTPRRQHVTPEEAKAKAEEALRA